MSDLDFDRDGANWPHRELSQFITAGGLRWHVQLSGDASKPVLLLLHGTGAANHTWRGMLPLLSNQFRIIAPDLPGHGFTDMPDPALMTLPGLSQAVTALLKTLDVAPALVAGHSAGAAILCRMALDDQIRPQAIISFNGALLPLPGVLGHFFSPMAKLLALSPLAPRLVAWRAMDQSAITRLISSTGSTLDEAGLQLYARLVQSPAHVSAVLAMLAGWDLKSLARDLPRLDVPVALIAADKDRTVPPGEATRAARALRRARVILMPGCGHLSHEERPDEATQILTSQFRRQAWKSAACEARHIRADTLHIGLEMS